MKSSFNKIMCLLTKKMRTFGLFIKLFNNCGWLDKTRSINWPYFIIASVF